MKALRHTLAVQQEQPAERMAEDVRHPDTLSQQAQVTATRAALEYATGLTHARQIGARYRAAADAERVRLDADRALLDQAEMLWLQQESARLAYEKALDNYC